MSAPKGNQFWKLRSKHGRDKLFATPKLLWEASCEYFQWCDENPLHEAKAFNTKDNGIVQEALPKMRAYTITGLCLYLDCSTQYFNNFEDNNKDSKDFMEVITRIRATIYTQKFVGAAADLLNSNIIAMELGLKLRTDVTTGGEKFNNDSIKIVLPNGKTIDDYNIEKK